jgi:hypothetical protein
MYFKMVAVCLAVALAPVLHAGIITNGDFQTGDLTGWTIYPTPTGTNGPGYPIATQFDVTGGGSSYAATFNVGITSGAGGTSDYEGGGIYQTVNLAGGSVAISFDWAESDTAAQTNSSAGRLELLLDGTVIGIQPDQSISAGQVFRGNLSGTGNVTAGSHEIRIQVTRNYYQTGDATTPFEYIDNVTVAGGTSTGTPEPGSSLLILAGMGFLLARRRLKNPV